MGVELLAALLAGSAITTSIMSGIKKLYAKIGTLPAGYQQFIVILIAFGVSKLSLLLGIPLPSDPSKWTGDVINTIIMALSAFGWHNLRKSHS